MNKEGIPERTTKSLQGLEDMLKFIGKQNTIVEVGAWTGAGSLVFSRYCEHLLCIDEWSPAYIIQGTTADKAYRVFRERTDIVDNISHYRNRSLVSATRYREMRLHADFVYIDADHEYKSVIEDITAWLPLTKKWIGGHDYCLKFPGVMKAVNELLGKPDKIFSDTSWIKRINI